MTTETRRLQSLIEMILLMDCKAQATRQLTTACISPLGQSCLSEVFLHCAPSLSFFADPPALQPQQN